MPRIVIDARKLSSTTGRYHRELLNELQKIDTETDYHVLILPVDQGAWVPTNKNFSLHVVPYDSYTFGEQLGLARYLYKLKPDLVHFVMPQQPLLYFGKRVTNIHDLTLLRFDNVDKNPLVYKTEKQIFKFLLKNVARRSKRIFTLTNYVKKDVLELVSVDADKIVVAKPAATRPKPVKPKKIASLQGKQFIMYVGQAFTHKNLEKLVEAFELLQQQYPRLHLLFVGKQSEFHKQLEAKTEHISNIHHTGYVEDGELAWLYQNAKAYVFPSLSEGFGLPGLEAMAQGLPVVSSNATCLPEVYGDAAHYFDPQSAEDMARAIDEVLRSKTRREQLIKAGFTQVQKYSWEKMAKKIHRAYFEVLP